MWIENNEKGRAKTYLKNDIEGTITNITDSSNQIHSVISALSAVASGTVTGIDQQMIDECQRALLQLNLALQNLYTCRNYANQLNTTEWTEDA